MQTKSKTFLRYPLYFAAILFLFFSCSKKNLTVRLELNSSARQVIYAVEKLKELEQTKALVFSDSNADVTIHAAIDSIHWIPAISLPVVCAG